MGYFNELSMDDPDADIWSDEGWHVASRRRPALSDKEAPMDIDEETRRIRESRAIEAERVTRGYTTSELCRFPDSGLRLLELEVAALRTQRDELIGLCTGWLEVLEHGDPITKVVRREAIKTLRAALANARGD